MGLNGKKELPVRKKYKKCHKDTICQAQELL